MQGRGRTGAGGESVMVGGAFCWRGIRGERSVLNGSLSWFDPEWA